MSAFRHASRTGAAITHRDENALSDHHAVAAPGTPDEGMDVKGIIKLLRRRLTLILLTVLVLTGATGLIVFNLIPQYRAVSAVLLEPQPRLIFDPTSAIDNLPQEAVSIQTQIALLQSRSYAENAIAALNLLDDPEFNIVLRQETEDAPRGALSLLTRWLPGDWWMPEAARAEQASGDPLDIAGEGQGRPDDAAISGLPARGLNQAGARLAELRGDLLGASAAPDSLTTATAEPYSPDEIMTAAAANLLDGLDVQQYGETRVIQIAYTAKDARTAARIANELTRIYIFDQLASKQAANDRASEWLNKRIAELHDQLLQSEAAVETYKAEHGLHNSQGVRFSEQHVATVSQALLAAQAEIADKDSRLRLIRELRGEGLESVPEVMNSPIIASLRQQQAVLLREEAQLSQEYGPRHPRILQVNADAQELAAKIQVEIENIVLSLERQLMAARAREEMLQADLVSARTEAATQNQADVELRMLEREAEANRALYTMLLSRFKELNEERTLVEAGVRLVSRATVPDEPSFPRPKLMMAAGFTGSLMLGVALAFIRDSLDNGLRSTRQVERVLGLPGLGYVPRVNHLRRCGGPVSYLLKRPQSAYAEAVRAVQTALYLSTVDDPPKTVLVTSSVPGEGKTTLALSMAVVAAGSGWKTILVDLDLRRPRVAEAFGCSRETVGLVEHVAGEANLDEAIRAGPYPLRLDFLPVGRRVTNTADLLASPWIEELITELRHRYDLIMLDSAPILGISDTKIAVCLADAVVLAVQWGKTTDDIALNGLQALLDSHARVAGAVLTQVNLRRHAKYGFGDAAQWHGEFTGYYSN